MKFWGIFRFELRYQARRAWPWLIFAVVLVLSLLMARDASLADAMYEEFFANSPFSIAKTTVLGTLIWLLLAPFIAGEAGARDAATAMHPLAYTVPISKREYLGGRFLAALVLNALILLAVQVGILLGVYSPGVDARVIGPFRPAAFLTAYAFLSLPNAFVATALQFGLAERSGRVMASYVGSVFLVFVGFFIGTILNFLVRQGLGTLLDPIGIQFAVEYLAHEWTPLERNTRLITLEGILLQNRLFWLGVGLVTLAVTYLRFKFAHRTELTWWWRRRVVLSEAKELLSAAAFTKADPSASPQDDGEGRAQDDSVAVETRKALAIAWTSFRTIATSWVGLAMLLAIPMVTVLVVLDQMAAVGTPLMPTTARVLSELTGGLSAELAAEPNRWVIIPLFIVFFAGELIWREREAGLGEITDALPGSEWAPFVGKFLGLGFMLALFMTVLMTSGMVAQLIMGYRTFDVALYLQVLFGLQLPEYLLFALLALVAHVLVNQKYVGHLVTILAYAFIVVLAPLLGIEHNMLVYGASPAWSYTEMRGFGATVGPWAWFKLYWAAWALLLAVGAKLLWMRGNENAVAVRLRTARRRITRPTAWVAAAAAGLVVVVGGFIFYNTNILNDYASSAEIKERRAEYERRYGGFERVVQPSLTGATLRVDIHPTARAAELRGSYRLVNTSGARIDSLHVTTSTGSADARTITFDRPAALVVNDDEHGYRIYALETPLEPGDTARLDFEVHVALRGFGNHGIDPSVSSTGSYFTNAGWFPALGYQPRRALISATDRREHGLAPRPVLASLYEEGRDAGVTGDGIAFEAVVGTDAGQVAVAPGALRRTWTERGRRYFQYSTDAPIGNEWAFFSANYDVQEGQWDGGPTKSGRPVTIRIFHDPRHTAPLDNMMRSVRASLDYYTKQFAPYRYGHINIVEHPSAPGTGAHADASMISYGQGWAYWIPTHESRRLDLPYAVMGHEMGHQWSLPLAHVEGLPFLAEGLAWYFGIQLVKDSRGGEQLRRLLSFMRGPYVHTPIRRGEPLLRALDPYQAYRKGPFVMYALSEYVGTNPVNSALRRLFEKSDSPGAPSVTTLDLYRELQAVTPDSLTPLLHDFFEVNAFWQLKTDRVAAVQTAANTWQVTFDVRARKMAYDSAGVERELPMTEWVQLGVFGRAEQGHEELSAPLYLQMHRIQSGAQRITVTVSGKPDLAGVDPYHLLDWEEREDDDNIDAVKIETPVAAATRPSKNGG